MALPLAYPAWRRATEYTADRCGLLACGRLESAERAMFIAAAGGRLGRTVSVSHYHGQVSESGGFWMTLKHVLSGEPAIVWRLSKLRRAAAPQAQSPAPRRSIMATILCAFVPGVSSQSAGMGGAAGALLTIAVVAILVSILLPTVSGAHARARDVKAMSDLHMLGSAVMMYSMDNEDCLPPSLEALEAHVPEVARLLNREDDRGEIHYLVEEMASPGDDGYCPTLYRLEGPFRTVLFYRYRRQCVLVCFVDGSIRKVTESEFRQLKARSIRDWEDQMR